MPKPKPDSNPNPNPNPHPSPEQVWFTKMKLDDPYGYVGGLKVTPDGCHVKPTSAAKIPHPVLLQLSPRDPPPVPILY